MPKYIDIDRFDEIVVGAGVDDFQGRGFGFIRAKHDDQGVDVSAGQSFQQVGAFPDAAGTNG
jgi:hypothetical protein